MYVHAHISKEGWGTGIIIRTCTHLQGEGWGTCMYTHLQRGTYIRTQKINPRHVCSEGQSNCPVTSTGRGIYVCMYIHFIHNNVHVHMFTLFRGYITIKHHVHVHVQCRKESRKQKKKKKERKHSRIHSILQHQILLYNSLTMALKLHAYQPQWL